VNAFEEDCHPMRPQLFFPAILMALLPVFAGADALTDLRAALKGLPGRVPVRGSIEVTTTSRSNEDDTPSPGKASIGFETDEAGLKILYPRAVLVQADQEEHGQAIDPERATPTRNGLRRLQPLGLAELLDAAAALNATLQNGQLVDARPSTYRGKPARLIVVKITPKLSKASSKHLKKLESTMTLWLTEEGLPAAAEQTTHVTASFLLMTFQSEQTHSWTFTHIGDRLLATRFEESQKSDGLGQHSTSLSTEVITLN
jgi:hypothetical protein